MMEALVIREAREADLFDVLRIYAQPEIDDGTILPLQDAQSIFARFRDYPDYHLYIAELNGRPVGTFALLIMDNLGHLGARSALAEDVAVLPEYQGRGIGREMMAYAIELAAGKRCYKLALSSNARRVDAHRFYESLGFTRHGFSFEVRLP